MPYKPWKRNLQSGVRKHTRLGSRRRSSGVLYSGMPRAGRR